MDILKFTIEDGKLISFEFVEQVPDDAVEGMLPFEFEPQGKVDVYLDNAGVLRHRPYKG